MKQKTSLLCLVLGAAAFIAGCSSKSPTAPPANPTPSAFSISLAASTNTAGINESVLIVAQVTSGGKAVADGTSVTFRTNIGLFADNGTQEITATTVNGRATATLVSADAGDGLVEARVPGAVSTIPIKFRGSNAADVAIFNILPNIGKPAGGDQVTILGRGFRLPVKVDFVANGEPRAAQSVQVNADGTQIICVTPATGVAVEPILASVTVTTGANTTTTFTNGFTFASEIGLPLLYSVNPQVGSSAGGYEVELVGKNLATATVKFSLGPPITVDRDAVKVSVSSDGTRLRVLVPQASPNPVTTDVNVGFVITNTIGAATYPNVFTYVADKRPPVIYYLSPDRGSIQGRELVTVYGKYFITPVKVTFVNVGDGEVQAVSPDGTQIQVLTPPVPGGASATPVLPVDVTVVTQAQTGRDEEYTRTQAYQYLEGEQPEIYQVSPNSGPIAGGTRVTLTGKGFLSPVQVTFSGAGGDVQAVVDSINYNQVVCVTPNMGPTNPGAVNIASNVVVRNGATGKVSPPQSFRFGSSMFISAFSPGTGPDLGGTVVTIFGQGFSAPVAVSVGGVAASVRTVSGTEVVVVTSPVPERSCTSQTGPVVVTNIDTGATASSTTQFTYQAATPLLISAATQLGSNIIPEPGAACSDGSAHPDWSTYTVTIKGTNFETLAGTTVSGMKVKLGTTPPIEVTTTYVSSTQVTFQVPNLSSFTFTEVVCPDDGTGKPGKRKVPTPLDVTIVNQNNKCESTLAGGLVISPCNQSCGTGGVTTLTVSLTPTTIALTAGGTATVGVTLSAPAPAGGAAVAVTTAGPAGVISVAPAVVNIPAGATYGTFTVTGVAAGGPVSIIAALPGALGGATATATATVVSSNYTISIDPTALNLAVGGTGNFNVILNNPAPVGGLIVQLSQTGAAGVISLPATVTVPGGSISASFQVNALAAGGPITITALLPSGVGGGSAQASVTVTQAQYTIVINPASISLPVGGTANFTATLNNPAPAGPPTVVTLIQTGPTGVISVSGGSITFNPGDTVQTFQVTGLAVGGPVSVTAALPSALGGATATTTITVTAPTLSMTFTPSSQTLALGGTANFNLALSSPAPAGGAAITLNVTGPNGIISVAPMTFTIPAGATNFYPIVVTALNIGGPVTITATLPAALGGATAQATVTVTQAVTINPGSLTIPVGTTGTFLVSIAAAQPVGFNAQVSFSGPDAIIGNVAGCGIPLPTILAFSANSTNATIQVLGCAIGGPVIMTITLPSTLPGGLGGATAQGTVNVTAPPAPTVTGVSPASGTALGGTAVTITGTNFYPGSIVQFGGQNAIGVTIVNTTTITCTTPPAAVVGSVDVSVTTSGGTASLVNGFTYTLPPAPTVTGVIPSSGCNTGGGSITITGTNFYGVPLVRFGGVLATSVVVVNPTTITCLAPAHTLGTVTVEVQTGSGTASLVGGFTYGNCVPPTVLSVAPPSGPIAGGTAVTITGTNFFAPATVTFGGIAATAIVVVNGTTITCNTPPGVVVPPAAVDVVVTTNAGSATLTGGYTYL